MVKIKKMLWKSIRNLLYLLFKLIIWTQLFGINEFICEIVNQFKR
jgi:hypothetical protein